MLQLKVINKTFMVKSASTMSSFPFRLYNQLLHWSQEPGLLFSQTLYNHHLQSKNVSRDYIAKCPHSKLGISVCDFQSKLGIDSLWRDIGCSCILTTKNSETPRRLELVEICYFHKWCHTRNLWFVSDDPLYDICEKKDGGLLKSADSYFW